MKQLSIMCRQAGHGCGGLNEILGTHNIKGTSRWKATIHYEQSQTVPQEIPEGECIHITMFLADNQVPSLSKDLIEFNKKLATGQKILFWVIDVTTLHIPGEVAI